MQMYAHIKKYTVGSLVVQLQMLFTQRYQMGFCSSLIFIVLHIWMDNSFFFPIFFFTVFNFYFLLLLLQVSKLVSSSPVLIKVIKLDQIKEFGS